MNAFLSPDVIVPSLWWSALKLVTVGLGLLFYGYLADRVIFESEGQVRTQNLGRADFVFVGGLVGFFVMLMSAHQGTVTAARLPTSTDMISGMLQSTGFFLLILTGIIGNLMARRVPCGEVFGFRRASFAVVVCSAALFLLMAYPLIDGTMNATHWFLKVTGFGDDGPQEIVRFLGAPGHGVVRAVVAISAIVFAPIQEEFIFRGYIYGVVRRYAGIGVGIVVNAAVFAGIHQHAPSFGGLFVLATCLTLAYEWTGSIFVPMMIHALFNSLTIFSLLTGHGNG